MPPKELKTVPEMIAELRSKPGIDISRQQAGTVILVETTDFVLELHIDKPATGVVTVTTTDPRFSRPTRGQLVRSIYDKEGKVELPFWIGKSMRMQIRFQNTTLDCKPAVKATIKGDDWSYDVF